MNDRSASELISKSMVGSLSTAERQELDGYLDASPQTRDFAQLSALIQRSVATLSNSDAELLSGPERLSEVSRERMRRSIQAELARSRSGDASASSRMVAELATQYYHSDAEPAAQAAGERHAVSRFTLIRKLGEGGLGTVWLARDEKLRRNVAIKEMNPTAAQSPQLWKRFEREAEITGHLEHPNVVPLYISGVNPVTGLPFYAMRFLGKQTLAEAIEEFHVRRTRGYEEPIQFHRLLTIFLDICQAIAYAHSRGVIHRDLKPENVALDNFGQVLVLDWGLAKLDSDGELATRLALSGGLASDGILGQTIDGDVVGTPLYMSPEQASGEMDSLDQRTDVYGLGAILFSMLTGRPPHENSSRAHRSPDSVKDFLKEIATSEPPRPRDINPSVPQELEAICLRAMSTQRYARHATAEELAGEVEGWIAGRHQRQAQYESMRLTGRDLKSRLCVQVRQLAVTAQFMVELPPIQGLLESQLDPQESSTSWRDRLSKILLALARTKTNLSALSYSQVAEDRLHELVRVERSLQDPANIRGIPASRLRVGATNTFHKIVMQQFPGEFCIDFDFTFAGCVRIVAGVPVFNQQTEEPYGLVLAEAEIGNLLRPEIAATNTNAIVYLVDDAGRLLYASHRSCLQEVQRADEWIPRWTSIAARLGKEPEYIEGDRELYATRLPFPNNSNGLTIVLQVAKPE